MKRRKRLNDLYLILFPAAGILLFLWYLKSAGADVVYSDYFRIIGQYLPDVTDPAKFFVPDVLTRIPVTFLQRIANVKYFAYSVTFDRLCGLLGVALMAAVISAYIKRLNLGFGRMLVIFVPLFCLNKWEILLNGTAWPHLLSYGLFMYNFYLFDLLWLGETTARQELVLLVMPFLWLLTAGEYIAAYLTVMTAASLFGILTGGSALRAGKNDQSLFRSIMLCSLMALALYMLSRHFAVWEHSGTADVSILELISEKPFFLPDLFIRSFSSDIIGVESASSLWGGLPAWVLIILGLIVWFAYFLALYLYFKGDVLERTVFPLMLLICGGISHILVCSARWSFLDPAYAMSSRYACQYMPGIVGILIIFAMYNEESRPFRRTSRGAKQFIKTFISLSAVLIVLGNCYTTVDELRKARYREENYERMADCIINYEEHSDEELCRTLEWHKDPDELVTAIKILEKNRLNVFRRIIPGAGNVQENTETPDKTAPDKTSADKAPAEAG